MALAPLHTSRLAKESDFVFVVMYSDTGFACAGRWESGLTLSDHGAHFICIRRASPRLNRLPPPPCSLALRAMDFSGSFGGAKCLGFVSSSGLDEL
jgi:hypothetical protein